MSVYDKEIVVKGIGQMKVVPDLIELKIRLDSIDLNYEKTMELATNALENLRNAIHSAGHDKKKLKTSLFNIGSEVHRYRDDDNVWQEQFMGYKCIQNLKLQFDYDMQTLKNTIAEIAKSDSKPDIKLFFTIKEPNAVKEALLEKAIENASKTADILAKSAGVKLGAIKRIDYNWSEVHLYSRTDYNVFKSIKSVFNEVVPATPKIMDFEPDDIDARDTASIVWEIA